MAEVSLGSRRRLTNTIAAVAATGGLLFGYDTGVISGALLFIKKDFALGAFGQEAVVSAVLVGCILGAALSGRLADRFGRRASIVACAAVFLLGSLASAAAVSAVTLACGRVVIGLAIGVASFTVPLYISELAPPDRRGALVSLNQLMITIGIVVSYLVDDLFAELAQGWRYMFLFGVLPALVLGVGMLFLPRSPRWLLMKGRDREAGQVLSRLLPPEEADRETGEIRRSLTGGDGGSWRQLAAPWLRPAMIVGVGIMFVQQVTGINTVIYYAPTIFEMAGFGSASVAIAATVGVGLVNVAFTVLAMRLIDRWGRKPLLSLGLIGMTASLFALGLSFELQHSLGAMLKWAAVASLLVYIASFALSLGPVAWLLISEIYPLKVRGLAMSLATLANWFCNLLIALSFLSIVDGLGSAGAFWLYAALGVMGWLFCRWFVPETKGRTLEQIEVNLLAGRPARELGAPPR